MKIYRAVATTAIALILAGCGGGNTDGISKADEPVDFPVTGALSIELDLMGTIAVNPYGEYGLGCAVSTGYDDIGAGTQVAVTNGSGEVLALAELTSGSLKQVGGRDVCWFYFSARVPEGSDFYGVEIAHRGVVRFDRADLDEELALGLN